MHKILFIATCLAFPVFLFSQQENFTQVSIPVFFSESDPSQQQSSTRQIGELSGIAMLLFENEKQMGHILLSRLGDPVLWLESVGISSKGTFIFPEKGTLFKMQLISSNNTLSVVLWQDERKCAWGNIAMEQRGYVMRLVGVPDEEATVGKILGTVNNYLMRLHMQARKMIKIKPGFNPDTLNVVMGPDSQFNTDFDLLWLDESLYQRVTKAAERAYRSMQDQGQPNFNEKTKNNALIEHTAKLSEADSSRQNGSILILFEVMGDKNYYFLKSAGRYQIAVDYIYQKPEGKGNLYFEKISLRNVDSGDFMEMNTIDLVANGIPLIYVDLINSVIMEDYGIWNIIQVITVIEDIFRIVDLPHEEGGF